MPRVTVGPGRELPHRIGLPPRWRAKERFLVLLLLPWLVGFSAMLLALAVVVCLGSMAIPRARRRVLGDVAALRHRAWVETDRFPVFPGETIELVLLQPSRPRLDALSVQLVCTERASYRQGTNTETATERVYAAEIVFDPAFAPGDPVPARLAGRATLPDDAMHSFAATHNHVVWSIEIVRTFRGTAPITRTREFVVAPPSLVAAGEDGIVDGIAGGLVGLRPAETERWRRAS
jgi:hypothetical protein